MIVVDLVIPEASATAGDDKSLFQVIFVLGEYKP